MPDLPQRVATSESIRELSMRFDLSEAPFPREPTEWSVVRAWGVMLVDLQERIERIESEVRASSGVHLPSTSLLLGPMLAARLCVVAYGRQRLARLPAGTIQVLGAERRRSSTTSAQELPRPNMGTSSPIRGSPDRRGGFAGRSLGCSPAESPSPPGSTNSEANRSPWMPSMRSALESRPFEPHIHQERGRDR